jgi:hypothetical protein
MERQDTATLIHEQIAEIILDEVIHEMILTVKISEV